MSLRTQQAVGLSSSSREAFPYEAVPKFLVLDHDAKYGLAVPATIESMKITPNAILSRNLAAVVDQALVIALPGKPSGAVKCLSFVQGAIPHAVAVAQGTPTSC